MNKTQIPSTSRMNNGTSNIDSRIRNRGTTIDAVYDPNQVLLDSNTFSNGVSNNSFQPSLTQFNSLPPGPYLAPPAMYGKTLEALASTSPSYTSYTSGPSPAVSPPNLNNFPISLSPPNPLSQSTSNLLLLSAYPLSNNTNNSLAMNLGMTSNGQISQPPQITNFANLITLLPSSTLSQLQQSLSSNWGTTIQNLNSVTSIPSATNPFTAGPSVNMNNSIPQSSSFYNTFPLNFGTKNVSFSQSGFPMKDSLVTQK